MEGVKTRVRRREVLPAELVLISFFSRMKKNAQKATKPTNEFQYTHVSSCLREAEEKRGLLIKMKLSFGALKNIPLPPHVKGKG